MKQGIHPQWHDDTAVSCACGSSFTTGSVLDSIQVDICSACHPYFTGEMKFVDRQGRVDKFQKQVAAAQAAQQVNQKKSTKKKTQQDDQSQSYKDILRQQQQQVRSQTPAN